MPQLRAEQLKNNTLNDLQIALNASIKQSKIANQTDDPNGWISKGTLHVVDTAPIWDGSQEGKMFYISSTDELYIGTGTSPFYALIANNGVTSGFDSDIESKVGNLGDDWNGTTAKVFSTSNTFSVDGSDLFVYLNGILLQKGNTKDYVIIDANTIELNGAIYDQDEVTFLIYKSVALSNYATKAYVNQSLGTISTDLIPATSSIDIGSTTNPIDHIYANEMFLSASSLYVNGKKVIEDTSNVMTFTTEVDRSMDVKTTGIGNLTLRSDNQLNAASKGGMEWIVPADIPSKNINFTNLSTSGQIVFTSNSAVIVSNDLTVSGNLTVNGTTTTIDTTNLVIEDNIITLNKNQTGIPASSLISGIEIERGDESNYRFTFKEIDQTFRVGVQGSEQAVATRQDTPTANAIPVWNDTAKRFDTSAITISGTVISGSITGNAATASSCSGNAASATYASTVTLTADNSTNATNYPLFVGAATGNLSPKTDTGFTFNPSTGALTATSFIGSATKLGSTTIGSSTVPIYLNAGTATVCSSLTLNTTGSSGSCTGNSATATTATTALRIRTSDPGSYTDGDIWIG